MTRIAERLVTAAEFERLPNPPAGTLELVPGRVIEVAPPDPRHGEKASDIDSALKPFLRSHGLGRVRVESGYWLAHDPDTIRGPDVSWVSPERLARETVRHGAAEPAPNLAVEIVPRTTRNREVAEKVAQYLAAGVERAWVVRRELQTVTVHRPHGDAHTYGAGDTLTSDDAGFPVEGSALPLAELFAD
jgi:Uma2 family endonuclease